MPFIRGQNHGDWTWLPSGYFLRWKNPTAESLHNTEVTFIIFSATPDLKKHLQQLVSKPDWRQSFMDPFGLLVIVAENLFLELSMTIDKVLCVLQYTEVLHSAGGEKTEQESDFVGLHNISKHVSYLKEGSLAAVALVKRFCEGHESIMRDTTCIERLDLMRSVHELLLHKATSFEGLVLRVAGMESLTQNLINLVRLLGDSNSLKEDSQAMKVIANLTIIFLPTTALATIFGSSFFNFNVANHEVIVAKNFELFWITAVPLSLAVIGLSVLWRCIASKFQVRKRRAVSLRYSGNLALPSKIVEVVWSIGVMFLYLEQLTRSICRRRTFGQLFSPWVQSGRANTGAPIQV
ncbi:MAG: hypothetical protein LQ343_006054 [Gyalolechia ehrenbergii]|nr:MAG: hypothetical protein LQ343_006054 [Gyalolechia ehrenbergii]